MLTIPSDELHTLRDWVRWTASCFHQSELFFGHGTDNPLDEALELVLAILHLDHNGADMLLDARVTQAEKLLLAKAVQQRVEQHLPLSYITGRAFFAGLRFKVNQHVLVPRSPFAELTDMAFAPWIDAPNNVRRVLDLCTGSGCIGIACAYAFPQAKVDLVDISPQALNIANENIQLHAVPGQVRAIESDVFSALGNTRYDLIVSNPPYVCTAEMETLPKEYQHEPSLGLAAGEDGMDVVSRILVQAKNHLNPDGILVIEVGASAGLLQARYPNIPFIWLDLAEGGEGIFLMTTEQLNNL